MGLRRRKGSQKCRSNVSKTDGAEPCFTAAAAPCGREFLPSGRPPSGADIGSKTGRPVPKTATPNSRHSAQRAAAAVKKLLRSPLRRPDDRRAEEKIRGGVLCQIRQKSLQLPKRSERGQASGFSERRKSSRRTAKARKRSSIPTRAGGKGKARQSRKAKSGGNAPRRTVQTPSGGRKTARG